MSKHVQTHRHLISVSWLTVIGVTPITVTLRDMTGQVIKVINTAPKGKLVKLGNELCGGAYIAEVTQRSNKQNVKLVKLN